MFVSKKRWGHQHTMPLLLNTLAASIYEFTCQCDSGYIVRTTQRLEERKNSQKFRVASPSQRIVKSARRLKNTTFRLEQPPRPRSCRSRSTTKTCNSAIGQHLLENPGYEKSYNGDMFRINCKARSSFHLAILESIHKSKKNPLLCRLK